MSIFIWWKSWGVGSMESDIANRGLFAPSPACFESAEGAVPMRMVKEEESASLATRPFNITNTGLQIQLHCTLTDAQMDMNISSDTIVRFIKADLGCVQRQDWSMSYSLVLALEDETSVASLFIPVPPNEAGSLHAIGCRRVNLLCQSADESSQGAFRNSYPLVPLMIRPLRGTQTLNSMIPRSMKFDYAIDLDNGVSSYLLVFQEGGNYGRGISARQGLSRYSTNACFFRFRDDDANFFSLKVMAETKPNFQTFINLLCFFKAESVPDPLSWSIQGSEGCTIPASFKMQSGESVFVSARYSVGKDGLRQLGLHVSVLEPYSSHQRAKPHKTPVHRLTSDRSTDIEQSRPMIMGRSPLYASPALDLLTKTPLGRFKKGDYFQS
jgi:hypothetical protein